MFSWFWRRQRKAEAKGRDRMRLDTLAALVEQRAAETRLIVEEGPDVDALMARIRDAHAEGRKAMRR